MSIVRYTRTTSTSDKAKLLANRGSAEWTVVVAKVQTEGRGHAGKSWSSPKGGLWFSVVLRPKIPVSRISLLQFLASNAVRRALIEETGLRAKTKWPNDLVLERGKLAGVLLESKVMGESVSFVVVGIGLNVNQGTSELPPGATSVYTISRHKHSLEGLMNRILENMKSDYDELDSPAKLLKEWWTGCIHRSKQVEVQTGSRIVKGVNTGVDLDGSLIIQTEKEAERVIEGTLRVVKNPRQGIKLQN